MYKTITMSVRFLHSSSFSLPLLVTGGWMNFVVSFYLLALLFSRMPEKKKIQNKMPQQCFVTFALSG